MLEPTQLAWAVGGPLAAGVLVWTAWWALRGVSERWADLALPLLVAGFAAAFFAVQPGSGFPPRDATHWPLYGALALIVVMVAEVALPPGRWWWRLPLWLVAAGLVLIPLSTAWRNLPALDGGPRWDWWQAWGAVAAWMLLAAAHRGSAGWLAIRSPPAAVLILGLTSAFAAVLMGFSGSQFIMPFRFAALGLLLLPLAGLLLLRRGLHLPPAAITLWSMLFCALVLSGYLYFALTPVSSLLLLAGPVLACLIPLGQKSWKRVLLIVAVGMVPPIVAIAIELPDVIRSFTAPDHGW